MATATSLRPFPHPSSTSEGSLKGFLGPSLYLDFLDKTLNGIDHAFRPTEVRGVAGWAIVNRKFASFRGLKTSHAFLILTRQRQIPLQY
jgi:hypothetical protein